MKPTPTASSYLRQLTKHGILPSSRLSSRRTGASFAPLQSSSLNATLTSPSSSQSVLNINKRALSMSRVSTAPETRTDVEREERNHKREMSAETMVNDPTRPLTHGVSTYDWLIEPEPIEVEAISVHSEAALIEGERLANTLRYLLKLDYEGTRDSITNTDGSFNGLSWMHVKTGAHIAYSKEHQDHLNYLHELTKDTPRISTASQLRSLFSQFRTMDMKAVDLYAMAENDATLTLAALYVFVGASNIALHNVPSSILRVLRDRALVFLNLPALLKSGSASARRIHELNVLCKLQDRFHIEALTVPLPFEVNTAEVDEAHVNHIAQGYEYNPETLPPSGKKVTVDIRASIFNNPDFLAKVEREKNQTQANIDSASTVTGEDFHLETGAGKGKGAEVASADSVAEDSENPSPFSVFSLYSTPDSLEILRMQLENSTFDQQWKVMRALKRHYGERRDRDEGEGRSGNRDEENSGDRKSPKGAEFLAFRRKDRGVNGRSKGKSNTNAATTGSGVGGNDVDPENLLFREDSRDYCDAQRYAQMIPALSRDLSSLQRHFARYIVGGVGKDSAKNTQFIPYRLMTDVLSLCLRHMIICRNMAAVNDVMSIAVMFAQPHLLDYSWISMASHMHARVHHAMKHSLHIRPELSPYSRLLNTQRAHTKEHNRLQRIIEDTIEYHGLSVTPPKTFDVEAIARYDDMQQRLVQKAFGTVVGGIYLFPSQFFNLSLRAEADAGVHDSTYLLAQLHARPHSPLTQYIGDRDPVFSEHEHMYADGMYNIAKRLRSQSMTRVGLNTNGVIQDKVAIADARYERRYSVLGTLPWVKKNQAYCDNVGLYSHPVIGRATIAFLEEFFLHVTGPNAPFWESMSRRDHDTLFSGGTDIVNSPERPLSQIFENPDAFLEGPGLQLNPFGGMSRQPQGPEDAHYLREIPLLSPSFYSAFIETLLFQHYGLPAADYQYKPAHTPLSLYSDVALDNPFLEAIARRAHADIQEGDADAHLLSIMKQVGPRPDAQNEAEHHDWHLDVITRIRQRHCQQITALLTVLHPRTLLGMDPRVLGLLLAVQGPKMSQTLVYKYMDALHALEEMEAQNKRRYSPPALNHVHLDELRVIRLYEEAVEKGTYALVEPVREVELRRASNAKVEIVDIDVEDVMKSLRRKKDRDRRHMEEAEKRVKGAEYGEFVDSLHIIEADVRDMATDTTRDANTGTSIAEEAEEQVGMRAECERTLLEAADSELEKYEGQSYPVRTTQQDQQQVSVEFDAEAEIEEEEEYEPPKQPQVRKKGRWDPESEKEEPVFEDFSGEALLRSMSFSERSSISIIPDSRDLQSLSIAHNMPLHDVEHEAWTDIKELLQLQHITQMNRIKDPRDGETNSEFHTSNLFLSHFHTRNVKMLGKTSKNPEYVRTKALKTYPPLTYASRTQQLLTLSYMLHFAPSIGLRAPEILMNLPDSHHSQLRHWLLPVLGMEQHYYRKVTSVIEGEDPNSVHFAHVRNNTETFLFQSEKMLQTRYIELSALEVRQKNSDTLTALHIVINYLRSVGTKDVHILGKVLAAISQKCNLPQISSELIDISQKRDPLSAMNPALAHAMRTKENPAEHLRLSRGYSSNMDVLSACKHLLLAFGCYEMLPIPNLPNHELYLSFIHELTNMTTATRPLDTIHDAAAAIVASTAPNMDPTQRLSDGEAVNALVQLVMSLVVEREQMLTITMSKYADQVRKDTACTTDEEVHAYLCPFNKPYKNEARDQYKRVFLPSGLVYRQLMDLLLNNDRYKDALKLMKVMMRTSTLMPFDMQRKATFTSMLQYICYRLQDVELAMLIWTEASTKYPKLITAESIQPAITIALAQGRCELARRLFSIAHAKNITFIEPIEDICRKLSAYTPLTETDAFTLSKDVSRPHITSPVAGYSRPADLPRLIGRAEVAGAIVAGSAKDCAENAPKMRAGGGTPMGTGASAKVSVPPPPNTLSAPPLPSDSLRRPPVPGALGLGMPRAPSFTSPASRRTEDGRKYYSTGSCGGVRGGLYRADTVREAHYDYDACDVACIVMGL